MVYQPAEDSELLKKAVEKLAIGKVVEIGTGSGVLAKAAAEKKEVKLVVAVDIDPEAIEYAQKNNSHEKIDYKESDLFENVKGRYDTIIFNPPYLPADEREDKKTALATTGGKKGHELTERFLLEASDYLETEGQILLLFSTLTTKEKIDEILEENLFEHEVVGELKIAFEKLYVYKITKAGLRKELENFGIVGLQRFARGHRGYIFTGTLYGKTSGESEGQTVAVKYQRPDSDAQGTVANEAQKLLILNKEGIGPEIISTGKDYFVYKFAKGEFILEYFSHVDYKEILRVLREVMVQMRTLDRLGLNKEEMHHPLKHIVVGENIVLLDFERCKRKKVHNVTQFVQFIVGGHMKPYMQGMQDTDRERLLDLAKEYSKDMTEEQFENILNLL